MAHFAAEDEEDGFYQIRKLLSYLPQNNMEDPPFVPTDDPADRGDEELGDLDADQRYLLLGDPAATKRLERARSVADRWPDNPVYYPNYVARVLDEVNAQVSSVHLKPETGPIDQARIDEALALLDRGDALDPASSARWFDGWIDRRTAPRGGSPPVAPPHTWMLRVGWRRHGLISPAEVPGRP